MIQINGFPVWGDVQQNAVDQMTNAMKTAHRGALMADHHLGYAVPVGGVIAYHDAVSPSAVGYDIACGNKAVRLDVTVGDIYKFMPKIMDMIVENVSFGVGRVNATKVDHALFDDAAWDFLDDGLKLKAEQQLGTVGSGNHYVDVFHDELNRVWVGVHFGSRGLGHTVATKYIKIGGGKDGVNVDPVVLSLDQDLGREYWQCMQLAGRYAYAGRDWVCQKVADLLMARVVEAVHIHHNYAWVEKGLVVVRKGATPCYPGKMGFIGSSMGEPSYVVKGRDSLSQELALNSAPHGAGRVMSRTEAAGKTKWKNGKRIQKTQGKISPQMLADATVGVELRGGGLDEAPQAYKRLPEVLREHADQLEQVHALTPMGVAMAGDGVYDPYKD